MPAPEEPLPGRAEPLVVPGRHFVNGNPMGPPFPGGMEQAMFGHGCFRSAERRFRQLDGA
jgi:peptide-methionine (S)-S-oxide reductase